MAGIFTFLGQTLGRMQAINWALVSEPGFFCEAGRHVVGFLDFFIDMFLEVQTKNSIQLKHMFRVFSQDHL